MRLLVLALIASLCTVPVYAATFHGIETTQLDINSDNSAGDGSDGRAPYELPAGWLLEAALGNARGTEFSDLTGTGPATDSLLGPALDPAPKVTCSPDCDWLADMSLGGALVLAGFGARTGRDESDPEDEDEDTQTGAGGPLFNGSNNGGAGGSILAGLSLLGGNGSGSGGASSGGGATQSGGSTGPGLPTLSSPSGFFGGSDDTLAGGSNAAVSPEDTVSTPPAVPGPATLPLLLAGLSVFGFISRKRRKTS